MRLTTLILNVSFNKLFDPMLTLKISFYELL